MDTLENYIYNATNGPITLAMNVIAFCFTDTAFWQRSLMPSVIILNDFTTYTNFIITCRGIFK